MSYEAVRGGSLNQRLRFLLNDSLLYGGAGALAKGVTILLLPLLTHALASREYGAVDVINVLSSLLAAVAVMGLDSAVARFYYETDDEAARRQIVTQALLLQLSIAIVVACTALLASGLLTQNVLRDDRFGPALWIGIIGIPFVVVMQFTRNLLKWVFARAAFLVVSIGSVIAVLTLSVIAVVVLHAGVRGVVLAQVIGASAAACAGLFFCRSYLTWPVRLDHARALLQFGWPYMLVAVLGGLMPAVDRTLLSQKLGLTEVGVYAVGYKIAFAMSIAVTAFQTAWNPMALAIYREANAHHTYNQVLVFYSVVLSAAAACIAISADSIVALFAARSYAGAAAAVLPIAFAVVIEEGGAIAGFGIDLSKRTYFSVLSFVIGLCVAALTISLLIPRIGMVGAAYGVLCGKIAQVTAYIAFSRLVHPLRVRLAAPVAISAAFFGGAFALNRFVTTPLPADIAITSVVAAGIVFTLRARLARETAVAVLHPEMAGD